MARDTIKRAINGVSKSLSSCPEEPDQITCSHCSSSGKIDDYDKVPTPGISVFITLRCRNCKHEFLLCYPPQPASLVEVDLDEVERKRASRKRNG